MPGHARYTLAWSENAGCYELHERGSVSHTLTLTDRWWSTWLEEHASFSFQGRQGRLTLLKEARPGGTQYWYAYRSLHRRTRKQYAGRSASLTIAHLEELAAAFSRQAGEPLLEPKLRPPRVRTALVERERLFSRLDDGRECALTLLCAPAGAGKTTLVSQWLNARQEQRPLERVAWVSLDAADNDPLRFWRSIVTACQRLQVVADRTRLEELDAGLSSSFEPPSLQHMLTRWLNELARTACSGLLVLDDYHLVTEACIHETLILFLAHAPATLRILVLTRHAPPFPLPRWRARGDLCEIQAADLRFSQEETTHFLQHTLTLAPGLLSTEDVYQAHKRTEGWAAGLRLLSLILQGCASRQEVTRALAHFAGEQPALQRYLVTEVLHALPHTLQDFLLQTSLLDRLTGDLCDTITSGQESARILAEIERAGIFLDALDGPGTWYRYHALFAEAMRVEARRRLSTHTLRSLFRRASRWYAHQQMAFEAIEAAFQAWDTGLAATLIEQALERPAKFLFGTHLLQQAPPFPTLRRWLEQLPEELLKSRPLLCLGYATSLVFASAQAQAPLPAESFARLLGTLQLAEDGWRREQNVARLGEVYAFRAMILRQPGAIREAMRYARRSLALLPADAVASRGMVLWLVGVGEMQEGRIQDAQRTFLQVRAFCETLGHAGIMRASTVWLSMVYIARGAFRQAGALLGQMLTEARAAQDSDDICDALLGLARLAYGRNELIGAEEQAQEALELAKSMASEALQVQATLLLAHIELARGHLSAARGRCSEQLGLLSAALPQRPQLERALQAMQARLALRQGDMITVKRWWESLSDSDELPLALCEEEQLLRARWLYAQNQAEAACLLLNALLADARQAGREVHTWEIQLLLAQGHAVRGDTPGARELLRNVIEQVHPEGEIRLFLDEGEALAALLQPLLPQLQGEAQRAFLRLLLFTFAQERIAPGRQLPSFAPLALPLSAQEQRVLRLLALGRSNPEIAHALVVSLNTIKTQVQSIYRKLNVHNRVEASELARSLNLL